jgi:tetratricopeptide (TPR) repeat protein
MTPEVAKLYNEGNGMLKANDFIGAISNYDKALSIEKDYRIYYQKGVAQKKTSDWTGAKVSFEESIKLKNDFESGYNALGSVYFSLGDYNQAIINFEKVLTLTSNSETITKVKQNLSLTYYKLGSQESTNGNSVKAIELFNKSIEFDNYDATFLSLAKLYSELGEWDKSISASENALKYINKITKGGPYYYMGMSYKGKSDLQKAKEMFEKAKQDPAYKKPAEYELSLLK